MNEAAIKDLLARVKSGSTDIATAFEALKTLPYDDIGFAKVDNHRSIRTGFAEVIFCPGKKLSHIIDIVARMQQSGSENIFGTRADGDVFSGLHKVYPDAVYYEDARIFSIAKNITPCGKGTIAVLTGGTADIPVAEEAAVTAELLGNTVTRIYDVGVAGIHRLMGNLEPILSANVIIAVAGMEGALASVVAGLVSRPVIAVPTSVGYGASFGGISALLCMLNSCAAGVSVVNIDNGFGAGYSAAVINKS